MSFLYRALKSEATVMLAATLMALGLFAGLDDFLSFCEWLQPFVYYWKYYVHSIVDAIFFWLPLDLPPSFKDLVALLVLSGSILFRVGSQQQRLIDSETDKVPEETMEGLAFYSRTALATTGFVSLLFMFPIFGWDPMTAEDAVNKNSGLPHYVGTYMEPTIRSIVVAIALGALYLCSGSPSTQVVTGLFGKYMFRVTAAFLTLVIINEIGLRYEDLKNWQETIQPPIATTRGIT